MWNRPWPWLTIASALVLITVVTLAYAQPVEPHPCTEVVGHEARVECWLEDMAASSAMASSAYGLLVEFTPVALVLATALTAALLAGMVLR